MELARIKRIGLGTNRLRRMHVEFVKDAVAAGVNFIDTAHLYTGGESEETIGAALAPLRDDCIVATKGGWNGARPKVLEAEIDESLRRLRANSIALYYLHRPDPRTPLEESLGALKDARDGGKIRHVGVSNVEVDQIERARKIVPVAAVQNRYNLGDRKHDDVVDYCEREGILFVAYYPLQGRGGTPPQVALARLLSRSPALAAIPGTLSLEHLKENLAALDERVT